MTSQAIIESEISAGPIPVSDRSFAKRWNHSELFGKGFVAVPTSFLRHYAHLQPYRLTTGEALFVLHLMEFKWDADAPFPGYATLAQRMGISLKMARRHAQQLEVKKYLRREIRRGKTNKFDLSPLFDALLKATQLEQKKASATRREKQSSTDEMLEWMTRMIQAFREMPRKDQKELLAWERENRDGNTVATSDWPGWERLIGKKPAA